MAVAIAASELRRFDAQVRGITERMRSLVDQAHVAACNRVANSVRAQAVRFVRERYPGFKAAAIRATMQIIRATYTKPTAIVRVRGKRSPLIAFSARQTRTGVSVRVRQRKTIRTAFIATMPSGHRGVFKRTGRFGRRGNPKLEKIAQLTTLSIPQALEQEAVVGDLKEYARERYMIEFRRELKFRTGRAAP
jgi:hypothetical protein